YSWTDLAKGVASPWGRDGPLPRPPRGHRVPLGPATRPPSALEVRTPPPERDMLSEKGRTRCCRPRSGSSFAARRSGLSVDSPLRRQRVFHSILGGEVPLRLANASERPSVREEVIFQHHAAAPAQRGDQLGEPRPLPLREGGGDGRDFLVAEPAKLL